MPKTRSNKSTVKNISNEVTESSSIQSLSLLTDENPSKIFVLPRNASPNARIVTLPNPISQQPTRYYICPENGIYEFLKVSSIKSDPRSWLLKRKDTTTDGLDNAWLSQAQDMFVATPIDAMFLLLSLLSPKTTTKESRKAMFLTLDDHIEYASNMAAQFRWLLQNRLFRPIFERRLGSICDVVEAGDESMFRLSIAKLANLLLEKAHRVVKRGLPVSLENQFVTRVLQSPIVTKKRPESQAVTEIPISQAVEVKVQNEAECQTSVTESSSLDESTSDSIMKEELGPETDTKTTGLLRIKTALDFILRSYIPVHERDGIWTELKDTNAIDFSELDIHLTQLQELRAEALALQSISNNISRKRPIEDDEANFIREEKKRKKEEDERKKKSESRAMKDLRKVNTSGMKKLSSFFTKKSAKT